MPEHYTGSMATALADQRISRKKAGEDVKILANRIALLKAEEQKVSHFCLLATNTELVHDVLSGLEKNRRNEEKGSGYFGSASTQYSKDPLKGCTPKPARI